MIISNSKDLKAAIRSGKYAFPGGYPLFFITKDGAVLSYDAVKDNYKLVLDAVRNQSNNGWLVVAEDINWEDDSLYCDHTGNKIESAYGEEE